MVLIGAMCCLGTSAVSAEDLRITAPDGGAFVSVAAAGVLPFSVHTTSPTLSPARIRTNVGGELAGALGYRYRELYLEAQLSYSRFGAADIRFAEGGGVLSGAFDQWGLMARGVFDIPLHAWLEPHLGGGLGGVRFRAREITLPDFPPTVGANTLLAYQFLAGVSLPTDRWRLSLSYRIMGMGAQDYETGDAELRGDPVRTHSLQLATQVFF